jgi:hypothetical protein
VAYVGGITCAARLVAISKIRLRIRVTRVGNGRLAFMEWRTIAQAFLPVPR